MIKKEHQDDLFPLTPSSPSCGLSLSPDSLRARSLQHAQVVVLFGGAQFEQTPAAVVEFEGGALSRHGVGEHGHHGVEVSGVAGVSPSAAGAPGTLRVLQPLDLGAAERELVKELLGLQTGNALGEVSHLQHPTHH